MTEPPRQDGAMLFLTIGWLALAVFMAVQKNVIGLVAALLGGGIMGAGLIYVRKKRQSSG